MPCDQIGKLLCVEACAKGKQPAEADYAIGQEAPGFLTNYKPVQVVADSSPAIYKDDSEMVVHMVLP